MAEEADLETKAYLARIRKTIAESENLISQAELRIAETDRMLERQGLTREQVMAMHFTERQLEAANDELRRRGLEPLTWGESEDLRCAAEEAPDIPRLPADAAADAELAERRRKFGMMMKPFQI